MDQPTRSDPQHSLARPSSAFQTVSVAEMERLDALAINAYGIPRLLLMEHAGVALARGTATLGLREGALRGAPRPIVICCGTGYNGGDGMAAARHLQAWGYAPQVALVGRRDQLRSEPSIYAKILCRLGIPLLELEDDHAMRQFDGWIEACGLVVDALLGIGVRGAVRQPYRDLIDRLNRSGRLIVAADLPSGLDGDTGLPQGVAVKAALTVTFGAAKRGCVMGDGPSYTGELVVDPITIPPKVLGGAG